MTKSIVIGTIRAMGVEDKQLSEVVKNWLGVGNIGPGKTVITMHEIDCTVGNPKKVFKAEVKPAVLELAIKSTARATAALMWIQENGTTEVPAGDVEELIRERVRGLQALGVEDVSGPITQEAKLMMTFPQNLDQIVASFSSQSKI